MKTTMRRNGNKMATIRIEAHISVDHIKNTVSYMIANGYDISSKAKIEERVREDILCRGILWFPEGDDIDDAQEQADQVVREFFPEFF